MECCSEIAMKVFFATPQPGSRTPGEATFILRKKANGVRDLVTRIVHRNSASQQNYLPLQTVRALSPDSFRIAVHEGIIYFLYSEAGSDKYHLAATSPVIGELPMTGFNLKLVANGQNHTTDLTLKKLVVYETPEEPLDRRYKLNDSPIDPEAN